jgi:hypothetical protein
VALSVGQSIHMLARLITEQQHVGDLPATRDQDLAREAGSCSAGSNRQRPAHPAAGS